MRRIILYTSGSTLVVKCLIFRQYGAILRAIIMSDKDYTVFTMKVEDYVIFFRIGKESGVVPEKKELHSCGWIY